MPAIHACSNRTDVARDVFYGSASRLYNERTKIIDRTVEVRMVPVEFPVGRR
jgi:hypothetical protein